MDTTTISGTTLFIIAACFVGWSWYDAISNDPEFKSQFPKRFRRGLILGFLLSIAGTGIGFATATKNGFDQFNTLQFVITSILCSVIATLEIAYLNALNPNPKCVSKSFLERFVTFGWVIAISLLGFTSIFLPYRLVAFLFE